jgi:hypothetical protein
LIAYHGACWVEQRTKQRPGLKELTFKWKKTGNTKGHYHHHVKGFALKRKIKQDKRQEAAFERWSGYFISDEKK